MENFKICRCHDVADSNGILYSPFLWDLKCINAIGLIKCQQASSGPESTKGKRKMDRSKLIRCSSNDAEAKGDEKTCAELKISHKHVHLRGVVPDLLFLREFKGISLVKEWHWQEFLIEDFQVNFGLQYDVIYLCVVVFPYITW